MWLAAVSCLVYVAVSAFMFPGAMEFPLRPAGLFHSFFLVSQEAELPYTGSSGLVLFTMAVIPCVSIGLEERERLEIRSERHCFKGVFPWWERQFLAR